MTVNDLKLDGYARVRVIQACGAGALGEALTLPGRQARKLVMTGYAEILSADVVADAPETAAKPRPQMRGAKPERRG